jgi:hypothetical protein
MCNARMLIVAYVLISFFWRDCDKLCKIPWGQAASAEIGTKNAQSISLQVYHYREHLCAPADLEPLSAWYMLGLVVFSDP